MKEADIKKSKKILKKYFSKEKKILLDEIDYFDDVRLIELMSYKGKYYEFSNYFNLPKNEILYLTNVPQKLKWIFLEYQDNLVLNNKTSIGMLARKILLYLWHDEWEKNNKKNDEKFDGTISFLDICNNLEKSNLLGKNQNKDFNEIRKIGNIANHEIIEITDEQKEKLKNCINNLINAIYYE